METQTVAIDDREEPGDETIDLPVSQEIVGDTKHAPVKYPTNYAETLVHLFKSNVGLGVFGMGSAFKNSGIVLGAVLVPLLGLICLHCEHLLVNASDHVKRSLKLDKNPDYALTTKMCFASGPLRLQQLTPYVQKFVNVFLCLAQLSFCCMYFTFISNSVKQIMDYNGYEHSIHLHMVLVLVPLMLCSTVRNLKFLVPLSALANICMLYGIVVIFYYFCRDPFAQVENIAKLHRLPLFLGSVLYSFEGIGLVLPLRNEMKNPQQFLKPYGVLNVGLTGVIILFWLMGLCSYLLYGEEALGNVIFNLPNDKLLAQTVQFVIPLGVLLTFALQLYIPVKVVFPIVQERFGPFRRPALTEVAVRLVFVLIIFALAEIVPALDLFISLVGAFCVTTMTLIVPPLLEFLIKSSSSQGCLVVLAVLTKTSYLLFDL